MRQSLTVMRRYGREPMSFTHGDFDEDYLRRLVLDPDGTPRTSRISFAAHFDKFMFGRKTIKRPSSEAALHPYRQRFADMFVRLRREHGVRFFLAHNMTVTPGNLDEVADVVRFGLSLPYGMFSFQPAAYLGDQRRWREQFRAAHPGRGMGRDRGGRRRAAGLHGAAVRRHPLQSDRPRACSSMAAGIRCSTATTRMTAPPEMHFCATWRETNFSGAPPAVVVTRLVRVLARHPAGLIIGLGWLQRTIRRAGGPLAVLRAATRGQLRPVTLCDAPVHGRRAGGTGVGAHAARRGGRRSRGAGRRRNGWLPATTPWPIQKTARSYRPVCNTRSSTPKRTRCCGRCCP